MTVPFLHLALIAVFAVALALARASGLRRWRAAPFAAAGALAAIAASLGWVPWIGEFRLTAYGACLLGAFIAAYLIAVPRAARIGVPERTVADLVLAALIAGIVGARARFVFENWTSFRDAADGSPLPWPAVLAAAADFDGGGMVWYGGLVLATVAVAVVGRRRRIPLLPLADAVAPAVLAGLAVGRLGCWFNGCCYGAPCDLPWAVLRPGHPVPIHPTQLYEAGAVAILTLGLIIGDRRPTRPGLVAGAGCVGYGAWRFFNETLRGDHHAGARVRFPGLGDISTSQATSVYVIILGLALLIVALARGERPAPPRPAPVAPAAD